MIKPIETTVRLQAVIDKLNHLVVRVTEKTDLAVFLTEICSNFRFEVKDNWANVDVITEDDELEALRLHIMQKAVKNKGITLNCSETERGRLCRDSYLKLKKKGYKVDLHMIMVYFNCI